MPALSSCDWICSLRASTSELMTFSGQVDLELLEQALEHGVAGLGGLVQPAGVGQSGGHVVAQLVQRVELRRGLGELVVQLGQLLLLDLGDGDLDVGLLALLRAADQGGGEVGRLAGGQTGDGLVETVEHAAGADLVLQALGGRVRQRLAVLGRDQVDGDDVTGGGGALDHGLGAEPLPQGAQLEVDLLVGDLDRVDRRGQRREVRQVELGAHVDLGGELDQVAVLQLGHLDLGLGQRVQVVLRDGLAVELRQRVVQRLLDDGPAAEPLVDHHRRHLALAEAGDVHRLRDLAVGLVQAGLEVVERHLDDELDPGGAQPVDTAGHARNS